MARIVLATLFLLPTSLFALIYDDGDFDLLLRGDADNNRTVNLVDVAVITNWLYLGGEEPPCLNQADVDNDGVVDLSDAIYLAHWLFAGGAAPPPTDFGGGSIVCGIDDTPTGCRVSPCR